MFADCMGLSTLRVGDDYTLIDYRRDMCEAKFYPGANCQPIIDK